MKLNDYAQRVLGMACQQPVPAMNEHERLVLRIFEAEFEILQGDIFAYIHNSSGDHIRDHIAAFHQIGAHRVAAAFDRLYQLIAERADPQDQAQRCATYPVISTEHPEVCDEIRHLITDHTEPWGEILARYYNERICQVA